MAVRTVPKLALFRRFFPTAGTLALVVAAALPAAAADIQQGERLYGQHCAACHGPRGTPVMPGATDFRRFDSLMRPDAQLLQSVRGGKGAMPGYLGILKDREVLDVIAFLRTLS